MVIVKVLQWMRRVCLGVILFFVSYPLFAGYYVVYNAPAVVEVCCNKKVSHVPSSTYKPHVKKHHAIAQEQPRVRSQGRKSHYSLTVTYPAPPCPDREIHPVSVRSTGKNQLGIIYQFTPADSLPAAELYDETSRGIATDMATGDDID